jgi:hypothetical protein
MGYGSAYEELADYDTNLQLSCRVGTSQRDGARSLVKIGQVAM